LAAFQFRGLLAETVILRNCETAELTPLPGGGRRLPHRCNYPAPARWSPAERRSRLPVTPTHPAGRAAMRPQSIHHPERNLTMPTTTLTHAFAAAAECPSGKPKINWYDNTITGFMLECRASGGKTYYLRYDKDGRLRTVKLAGFSDAPFAQIKKKAQKLKAEAALGGDPAAEKAERRAVPIYAELAAQHMADAKLHQKSYPTTEGYIRNHIVSRWGRTRLTDIDSRAVAQWLASKREGGLSVATVEKMRAIMSRSFELGAQWGVAGCERNPCRGVPRKPLNNARERFVTADEAARLVTAASASRNAQLAAIVQLLLLTGMRVSELLSAKWENVDAERRTLFVPTSKTGRSRHVPLAQAALDVITTLPKKEGATYLFPAPRDPKKHLTTIKHGWQTAREAADLPGLRIHDLRHSAASFMVNSGVDLFAVGKVLGHASVQSTQRYSHLANSTLLAAVEAGAAKQTQPA
jgi:integrase